MTALVDRPHSTLTDCFEEAARIIDRAEEGARLELIDGKIWSKAVPGGDGITLDTEALKDGVS
ncbi:hypothetical protein ACFCXR_03945 [Streptomyces noursei]|uniref:hypothetical protein n=1 Tax=Streptomyces noursei TaxID=1971 RepID=UPI0035DBD29B